MIDIQAGRLSVYRALRKGVFATVVLAVGLLTAAAVSGVAEPSPPQIPDRAPRATGSTESPIVDLDAFAALAAESQDAVLAARVPVLVPRSAAIAEKVTISNTSSGLYILKFASPEIAFVLYGGGPPANSAPRELPSWRGLVSRGEGSYVAVSEGVWNIRWTENGVSYLLSFACEPESSYLCATPSAAVAAVDDLVLVGGEDAAQ